MATTTTTTNGRHHGPLPVIPQAAQEEERLPLSAAAFGDGDGERVLGMLLYGGREALDLATEHGLQRRDFYREAHKAVYTAIVAISDRDPALLPENVLEALERAEVPQADRPLLFDLEGWRNRGETWPLLPGYVQRLQQARQERTLQQALTRAQAAIDRGDVQAAQEVIRTTNDLYCLVPPGESIRQDNTNTSPGGASQQLPFAPMSEALALASEAPDPLVTGLLYPGALTGMSAREKIGKTTLSFALFKALERGDPFLGLPTRAAGVLLLTEENPDTIAEKQELWGIGDHIHVLYRHQAEDTPFKEVMRQAKEYALAHGLAGIVVDTFFEWSGLAGEEENQSGSVKAAVKVARAVVGDGSLFVLLVCHDSKGGPWRGSTVLPAMLDVKLELRVPSGEDAETTNRRVLTGKGRYAAIPRALLCELSADGTTYKNLGEPAPRERTERNKVVAAVAQIGTPTTWEAVADKLALSKPQTLALLRQAVRAGELLCEGRGVRNEPMKFRAPAPAGLVLDCLAPLGEPAKTTQIEGGR